MYSLDNSYERSEPADRFDWCSNSVLSIEEKSRGLFGLKKKGTKCDTGSARIKLSRSEIGCRHGQLKEATRLLKQFLINVRLKSQNICINK